MLSVGSLGSMPEATSISRSLMSPSSYFSEHEFGCVIRTVTDFAFSLGFVATSAASST